MTNLKIETRVRRLTHYLQDIRDGQIQVPSFQRDFVWSTSAILDLFDSIKRGYPIGSILFWRPESEEFGTNEYFGPYKIDKKPEKYFYVLDGYQRLTSLFACLINPSDFDDDRIDHEKLKKIFNICYDLETEEFFISRSISLKSFQVSIYALINTRATFSFERSLNKEGFPEKLIENYLDRYEKLGTQLIDYEIPSVDIEGGNIGEAVEIFSRVNSKGTEISSDWMVSALTYSLDNTFRLGSEISQLKTDLKLYNWDKLKRDIIFKCILHSFGKPFFDQSKKIENLAKRHDFIEKTRSAFVAIKKAVKFLFEELLVVDSKLLPYSTQLIFIVDFFNQVKSPTHEQLDELKSWFWKTTYTNYFTIYSLSKQREAYNKFQKFINGTKSNPYYVDSIINRPTVSDWPDKVSFGSVRSKSVLLFLLNESNNWQKCSSELVTGFNIEYIYEKYIGSAIIYLESNEYLGEKIKEWVDLFEYQNDYRNLFLNDSFRNIQSEFDISLFRQNAIFAEERQFLNRLDLNYESGFELAR